MTIAEMRAMAKAASARRGITITPEDINMTRVRNEGVTHPKGDAITTKREPAKVKVEVDKNDI